VTQPKATSGWQCLNLSRQTKIRCLDLPWSQKQPLPLHLNEFEACCVSFGHEFEVEVDVDVDVDVDHRFKINMGALGTEAHRALILEGTDGKPSTQRPKDPCNGGARSKRPLNRAAH
jgi:hypothetical protein